MFIFIAFWLTDDFFHTYYTKHIYSITFSGHSSNALIIKLLIEYKRKHFKLFNSNVFFYWRIYSVPYLLWENIFIKWLKIFFSILSINLSLKVLSILEWKMPEMRRHIIIDAFYPIIAFLMCSYLILTTKAQYLLY